MTEPTGQTPLPCPYCHAPCDEATRCPACNAAHHPDCWSELGGCAVAGCDGRPPITQAPEQPATQAGTASPRPPSDAGHTSSAPSSPHQGPPQPPPTQAPGGPQRPGQTGASPGRGATPGQSRPGDWATTPSRQPPLTADGHPISAGVDVGEFIRRPWVWGTGIAVLLLVLVLAAGGNADRELDRLAADTCDAVTDESMLAAAFIIERAVSDAEELGFEGWELGNAMRDECPGIMQQIDDFG